MNNAKITKVENNTVHLSVLQENKRVILKLKEILFNHTKEDWKIVTSQGKVSTKETLIKDLVTSNQWKIIIDNFPDATISDIIFKVEQGKWVLSKNL